MSSGSGTGGGIRSRKIDSPSTPRRSNVTMTPLLRWQCGIVQAGREDPRAGRLHLGLERLDRRRRPLDLSSVMGSRVVPARAWVDSRYRGMWRSSVAGHSGLSPDYERRAFGWTLPAWRDQVRRQ